MLGIAIALLFLFFGALCGWFLGLAGFIEATKLSDFRESYRVRNLQYLVGGLILAFVGDYKKFGLADEYVLAPALCFAFGALAAFFITVNRTQASIQKSVQLFNAQREPHYRLDVHFASIALLLGIIMAASIIYVGKWLYSRDAKIGG